MTTREDTGDRSKIQHVYDVLRGRIRDLSLAPGTPLHRDEIARTTGVSRGPVRDALSRLAAESLVEVKPRGSIVAPIRSLDIRDSMLIRTALEIEATRRAAEMHDGALVKILETNLAAQEAALQAGDVAMLHDLDEAMHNAIFAVACGPRTMRLLEAARAPLERPRRMALPEPGRPEATVDEHRRIVNAIRAGDGQYASSAMRAHLLAVSAVLEHALSLIEADSSPQTHHEPRN